jgi:hypothetical protein
LIAILPGQSDRLAIDCKLQFFVASRTRDPSPEIVAETLAAKFDQGLVAAAQRPIGQLLVRHLGYRCIQRLQRPIYRMAA